ncbi:ROK family transcriptional regulator [Bifidobacterium vespertilionis]|uniref:ROK family transcriptional regulator n=2 Tax=Bifidobacterium vespertilionis TaxID=2562524 RepID=A0A5J5DTA4_9BIFI|nr:ROK family transcriptional regulator [Bifidobacterium vespertilionis]KAA8823052.1 ROK family transcriptional regulator [Bifidobacterium vespertilionis]
MHNESNSARKGIGMTYETLPHWFSGSPLTHTVARDIMQYGPIARTAIAQMHGLSQGTVSRITSDLMHWGVIRETGAATGTGEATAGDGRLPYGFEPKQRTGERGRPQTALEIVSDGHVFAGVKLHDRMATGILTDARCRQLGDAITVPCDDSHADAVAEAIGGLVEALRSSARAQGLPDPQAMGVAIGGYVTEAGNPVEAPFLHWHAEVDLAAMLDDRCGVPTGVFNDIDSLLLHELWFGEAIGLPRCAMVTIGAGVGYGLAEDGRIVGAQDRTYGLAGHLLVDPDGPACFAGLNHRGCAQCLINDSLADEYSKAIGSSSSYDDYAAAARRGVPQARQLLMREAYRLGVLIGLAANLTMPVKVLVAGEGAPLAAVEMESIRRGVREFRPSQAPDVRFAMLPGGWERWAAGAATQIIARFVG